MNDTLYGLKISVSVYCSIGVPYVTSTRGGIMMSKDRAAILTINNAEFIWPSFRLQAMCFS